MPLAKPTKPDAITAVPTPVPLRTDRANFAARGDAMMGWFPTGIAGVNTTLTYFGNAVNFVEQEANEAEASATAAAASNAAAAVNAAAAAASAGATVWVTGSTYTAGVVRYSPTNFSTYRDTVGGLSSTDPASDTTGRWQSAMLPSAEAIALPDLLPTAYFNFAGGVIDRRFVPSRATPTTRRNIFGNVETVAAGIALPDFDPLTKRCLGYRSSPAATYLPMQSEALIGNWINAGITVTAGARRGPDGLLSAYKLEVNAAWPTYTRDVAATSAQQYFAVTVYKGTGATVGNAFTIRNDTTGINLVNLTLDYDTGAVSHFIGAGATAQAVPDGWLLRIPVTTGVTIGDTLRVYLGFTGGAATVGHNIYVAQPHFSDKPNAPYYPTAGSNVALSADKLALDLTAHTSIINPLQHTIVVAFDGSTIPAAASDHMLVNLSGSAGAEQIRIKVNTGVVYAEAVTGGVTVASLNLGAVIAGRNVVAFSVAANNFAAVARGGAVATDTSGAMPIVTTLGVGCNPASAGSEPSACIEVLAPFPRACTAGELRAFVNNY